MSVGIKIELGEVELEGELADTECAEQIAVRLPVKEGFQTWGDEIYFPIGLDMGLDDTAKREVDIGTIGYWPAGNSLALFYGPTPQSEGDKPVAASEVNIVGEFEDVERLKEVVSSGESTTVKIER